MSGDKVLKKLFVIGDSISMHYGPYLEKLCEGEFVYRRKSGDEGYKNSGIPEGPNGGDSGMVRKFIEWQEKNNRINYDIVLINCGLHDIKNKDGRIQVELPQYRENLKSVIDIYKKKHVRAIWVRTTPVFDEIHNGKPKAFKRYRADVLRYNAAADEIMMENHIECIDLYGFTLPLLPDGYCNHVHFAKQVRQSQAEFIFKFIG